MFSYLYQEQLTDGVVDLTATKDMEKHMPTAEERNLAQELSRSPLIPALDVISPLPELEWGLFYATISAIPNV